MSKPAMAAVLHGAVPPEAPPDEQDVLIEAGVVCAALRRLGYKAQSVELGLDLAGAAEALQRLAPALVFNLVESVEGSGALIHLAPALLEHLGLPYTGAPLSAMYLSSNKLLAKGWLQRHGLPTPEWVAPGDAPPAQDGGRWIAKSVWEHASIGLEDDSLCTAGGIPALLAARAARLGGEWFAERFVDGREFNLALLASSEGPQLLPPAEMRFVDFPPAKPRIVNYRAKWDPASFEYHHTVRSFACPTADRGLHEALRALSLRCWHAFGLRGYARVDFRVDAEGRPWILEVNANPCLAPDAGFQAALDEAGIGIDEAIARIAADRNSPLAGSARSEPAAAAHG